MAIESGAQLQLPEQDPRSRSLTLAVTLCRILGQESNLAPLLTIQEQDSSLPPAARVYFVVRALQPAAAKLALQKLLRTTAGGEEP